MFFLKYTCGCKRWIRSQEKKTYYQNDKEALSFTKINIQYMNIKKKMFVPRRILKTVVWFFTVTSGQILCWVLVVFLLDGYHVAVLNVYGNWIIF